MTHGLRFTTDIRRVFLLLCAVLGVGPAYAVEDVLAAAKTSVVAIRTYHANNTRMHGSAVRIGPGTLVTNCHVTLGARRIEVEQNAQRWPAHIATESVARDICVLRAAGLISPLAQRRSAVVVGQIVYAVGFPADQGVTISSGQVIALHEHDGGQVLQVSAPFDYGSSGGGLFDEEGRLVGILAFKARAGGQFHFALPIAWLEESAASMPGRTSIGRAFWQAEGRDLPYFLRAVSLEAAGKWPALANLAREWTRDEPSNSGAWRALRRAHLRIEPRQSAVSFVTEM